MSDSMARSRTVSDFVSGLGADHRSRWAHPNFRNVVKEAIRYFGAKTVIEMGAGRAPRFSPEEMSELGVEYVLNDVSARELERAPAGYDRKLHHDFSTGRPDIECDLIFSRMVHEHVADNRANLGNQLATLRPGGVVIHFHPVLFSLPCVLNRLLPEGIGGRLLRLVQPHRTDDGRPKFPAKYNWCFATEGQRQRILGLGFSECELVPFYGHNYLEPIPGAQSVVDRLAASLARRNMRLLANSCYTIARR